MRNYTEENRVKSTIRTEKMR